jgi:hypothetical protein
MTGSDVNSSAKKSQGGGSIQDMFTNGVVKPSNFMSLNPQIAKEKKPIAQSMLNVSMSRRNPILEKIHEKNENSDSSCGGGIISKKRSSQRNKENNMDKLNSSSFSKHSKKSISKKSKNSSFKTNKADYRNFQHMMMDASGLGVGKN